MVVIVIPIIEEFSMRGLFVVNNKLNIILWTLCLIAVFFYLYFTTVGFNTSNVRANHFKSTIIFNFEFRRTFNRFISNYFLFFYILTSIVFGLLHLSNYPTLDTHTVLKIFLEY
jgi:uncharacterized membrane protein (DUF106 family)